jgi:hypothetical protein
MMQGQHHYKIKNHDVDVAFWLCRYEQNSNANANAWAIALLTLFIPNYIQLTEDEL